MENGTRTTVAEPDKICLATAMTSTSTLEPADPESWTAQHWSREEWFYVWTKGLDPWRIAVLCRVPYRKVYDHIRTRITYHPDLFGQRLMVHDQPALPPGGLKKPKPTWEERAADLVDFRQVYGRFPRGYLEGESSLYQRQQYRAGKGEPPARCLRHYRARAIHSSTAIRRRSFEEPLRHVSGRTS